MATSRDIDFRNYCDTVYSELSGMKSKLLDFIGQIEHMRGSERDALQSHVSHFNDIIRTIDWKLEILTRACPFEWAGYNNVESTASIRLDEELDHMEPVSGYVGG